jgi:aminopeptidase YwaD
MMFSLRRILLVFVFVAIFCSPTLARGAEVSGDNAYAHVEFLVSVAPRFAGTGAEAIAASYIENQFRSYGLETWVENFTIENSYVVEENLLRVVSPENFDLTFIPAVYSPSTDNLVSGRLVRVVGAPENLEQLRGRVVLIERRDLTRAIVDLPPLAVLTYLEDWPPYSEIWIDPPKAPLLWISGSDAQRLIELLGRGNVEVEVQLTARSENAISYNVLALLPGQSEEIIVVGAHHDSVLTPGAVDGATGVAVVLEIARVLSMENLPRTILFASFGSKEPGLLGSAAFVREHAENNIVAAVIFDAIAPGPENGLRVGLRDSPKYATTDWLDFHVQEFAKNLGFYVRSEHLHAVGKYSDHASFTRAGIPGTWIYWVNPEHGELLWPVHTLADNLDAVDNVRLEQVASLGVQLVRWLAGEDLEALRRAYMLPLLLAAFAVASAGAVVLSVTAGSFMRYRRGWGWSRAASVFSLLTALVMVVAYLLLLA